MQHTCGGQRTIQDVSALFFQHMGPRDLTQVVRLGKCISLQMQLMSTSDNCRGWIEGQGEVSKTGKHRYYPQMISCSDQDSRIRETGG